jgi:hypothetical protein
MRTHNLTHLHYDFVLQRKVMITVQVIGSMVQSLKYTYILMYTLLAPSFRVEEVKLSL